MRDDDDIDEDHDFDGFDDDDADDGDFDDMTLHIDLLDREVSGPFMQMDRDGRPMLELYRLFKGRSKKTGRLTTLASFVARIPSTMDRQDVVDAYKHDRYRVLVKGPASTIIASKDLDLRGAAPSPPPAPAPKAAPSAAEDQQSWMQTNIENAKLEVRLEAMKERQADLTARLGKAEEAAERLAGVERQSADLKHQNARLEAELAETRAALERLRLERPATNDELVERTHQVIAQATQLRTLLDGGKTSAGPGVGEAITTTLDGLMSGANRLLALGKFLDVVH